VLWLALGAASVAFDARAVAFDARAEAGDAEAGRVLFAACQACHGPRGEGIPASNAPNLAGQTGSYLARQLQNFRTGIRGAVESDVEGAKMRAVAAVLSDEQISDLMAYVATLPEPTTPATVVGDLRNGSNYYQMKCNACHGLRAEGNALLDAPRLAGTSDAYLLRQLGGFVNGLRGTHAEDRPGRQMTLMARTLPDEQTRRDVIAFVRSLAQTRGAPAPAHGKPRG
jgi:cytochrome c oxidase subunit 2